MKTSEILTLLKAGTDRNVVWTAEIAGRMETVVQAAERKLDCAEQFGSAADWTEILRIMEGTLEAEQEYRSEQHRPHRKEPNY